MPKARPIKSVQRYGSTGVSKNPAATLPPSAQDVLILHTNADTDVSAVSAHHTLGVNSTQASPGSHRHNGQDSLQLGAGLSITGSKSDGSALASIIDTLTSVLGVADETGP